MATKVNTLTGRSRLQLWSCRERCARCQGCCRRGVQPTCHRRLWRSTVAEHRHMI